MSKKHFSVRAVDVGYGHLKFTDGRGEDGQIKCDRFPSQSPPAKDSLLAEGDAGAVMHRRDTFVVDIGGRLYEVGKAVEEAIAPNQEGSVLDLDFSMSDAYRARLYGALSYIRQSLGNDTLDFLILGLPLNTYRQRHADLAKRFTGRHQINTRGDVVSIGQCFVYPQPLGSYYSFVSRHARGSEPAALIIDVGYNTVDWMVCQGMSARFNLSGAVLRGMSSVLRATAEAVLDATKGDVNPTEVMRLLDRSFVTGADFKLWGRPVKLDKMQKAGASVIDEAAQSVKNSVGSGADIDVIVLTGGGAGAYAEVIKKKFPRHEVTVLDEPSYANVRGFHLLGELFAQSAQRAAGATS